MQRAIGTDEDGIERNLAKVELAHVRIIDQPLSGGQLHCEPVTCEWLLLAMLCRSAACGSSMRSSKNSSIRISLPSLATVTLIRPMADNEQDLYPIDVDLSSRPIRIVFLVPIEEDPTSHLILDAVFRAGYAAWNGGYFLIVPVAAGGIPDPQYRSWMAALDPDWIYSYVDLNDQFINQTNAELCPMAFFRHGIRGEVTELRPFHFVPSYDGSNPPLSSTTCLFDVPRRSDSALPAVLGVFDDNRVSRFIGDNFGYTHFNRDIPGLCSVKLLCPETLPSSHVANVDRVHDDHAIVAAIRKGQLVASSDLARSLRTGQPGIREHAHIEALYLTVGETIRDRIDAWNRRLLIGEHLSAAASLRLSIAEFSNNNLAYEVAELMLHLDSGSRIPLHICSHSHDELTVRAVLGGMTGRLARVFRDKAHWSNAPAYPHEQVSREALQIRFMNEGTTTIVHKPSQAVGLPRPDHIRRLPPTFGSLNHGAWMTDVLLGRPETERTYINVAPRWVLPRRIAVAHLITSSPARIDRHGRLAVLAHVRDARLWSNQEPNRTAALVSPRVIDVLQCAIQPHARNQSSDQYTAVPKGNHQLAVSDKGQHLQGVVKIFDGLEQAGTFVMNSHWRRLLASARDKSGRQVKWKIEEAHELIERLSVLNAIASAHHADTSAAARLLNAKIKDALESFIQHGVIYRGHQWRCAYCGNDNIVGIGKLGETMTCDVCEHEYVLPLDITFSFMWNDFLHQALITSNGLPVVWALDQARRNARSCFAWMPEVAIEWANSSSGNEVDYLAICDGKIIACEAKKAAAVFLDKDPDGSKFAKIISDLGADEAVLAFERVGQPPEDLIGMRKEIVRVAERIQKSTGITVRVIVADETSEFRDPPIEFGAFGQREWRLLI